MNDCQIVIKQSVGVPVLSMHALAKGSAAAVITSKKPGSPLCSGLLWLCGNNDFGHDCKTLQACLLSVPALSSFDFKNKSNRKSS